MNLTACSQAAQNTASCLRQDNADLAAKRNGLSFRFDQFGSIQTSARKETAIETQTARLTKTFKQVGGKSASLAQLLCRPEYTYTLLLEQYPEHVVDCGTEINFHIELNLKYAGYIGRQATEAAKLETIEQIMFLKALTF